MSTLRPEGSKECLDGQIKLNQNFGELKQILIPILLLNPSDFIFVHVCLMLKKIF